MNASLQIFLNCPEIKDVFLREGFYDSSVNFRNTLNSSGELLKAFLDILKLKWTKNEKVIKPRNFKEEIGLVNSTFSGFGQQDSHEFLNAFIDGIHEEINLVTRKESVCSPANFQGTTEEFAQFCWANYLRRDCSYIHSFFAGQTVTLRECSKGCSKTSFETFLTLPVAFPEPEKIKVYVAVYRLPFTTLYCSKLKNVPLERRVSNLEDSVIDDKSVKIVRQDSMTSEYQHLVQSNRNKLQKDELSRAIPIKLTLELNRKDRIGSILDQIKKLSELSLSAEDEEVSSFLFYKGKRGGLLSREDKVDGLLENGDSVFLHQILNETGMTNLFDMKEGSAKFCFNIPVTNYKPSPKNTYLLGKTAYTPFLSENRYFIPVKDKEFYSSGTLYEMVFDKFSYILNNPAAIRLKFSPEDCYPFALTVVNSSTQRCMLCHDNVFCEGCRLEFDHTKKIRFNMYSQVRVHWCAKVLLTEVQPQSASLVLVGSQYEEIKSEQSSLSLEDLIKPRKEEIEDIPKCFQCNQKAKMHSTTQFQRTADYLILVLSRFKMTRK